MSLMGMRRFFTKFGPFVYVPLVLAFAVGGFVGLGSYLFGDSTQAQSNEPPVASIGDMQVTAASLDQQLNEVMQQQGQMMGNPSPAERPRLRLMILDQYKQMQALAQAAKQAGITVSDAEIERARNEQWAQQRPQIISRLGLNEKATDREIDAAFAKFDANYSVRALKEGVPEERLRNQIYFQKLQDKFKAEARAAANPDQVRKALSDIKVRHILVKFGEGALPEAQARAKAQKLLDAVKANPAQMADLARKNSDDEGSKASGGMYDWPPSQRASIVAPFREAMMATKPGETYPELVRVSNPPPGYSGFHIVRVEEVKQGKEFPKDFDKQTQKYVEEQVNNVASQKAQDAVVAALPGVKMTLSDPMLRAAQLQMEADNAQADKQAREAKLNAALAELAKVKATDDGSVLFQRAAIYEALGKTAEAIAAYKEALSFDRSLSTRLALARLYSQQKDTKAAVAELQEAEKVVYSDISSQVQIAELYRQAGRKDLAAAANKKVQEMLKRQAEMSQGGAAGANIPLPAAAPDKPKAGG